jgi:hypothetical protein
MRLQIRSAAVPFLGLLAAIFFGGGAASVAQNSDVNLALHANSHTTAADIGVPAYPGAKAYKKPDSDSSVDLGFTLGDTNFRLMAADYVTTDSPAQVLAFYRKPLSRYGEVLECDHGKAVGALTLARSGLTCSDEKGDHMQVDSHVDSSTDHELRAGSPHKFRIVAIDESHTGSTRFGLVYIELPKDKDSDEKSK